MSKTFGIFTPRDHEEYAHLYWSRGEQERKMSRAQHESEIFRCRGWLEGDPEFEMFLAAGFLAAAGVLGDPDSRLGATREEALRFMRRRLTKAHMVELEETLEDYDLSAPHPRYVFGPGWTEADDRILSARSTASDEREGIQTEEQWFAERHRHWYYRLIDWLPSRYRVIYALSVPRRWRWMRYAI
jgi:hypothetical protein